jgi:hypothetical protein
MSLLVPIVMFGWIPVVVGLFAMMPPRRAVLTSFLIAWLFLPIAGYKIEGLPAYTKMSATCVGALLGAALFDRGRLLSFRLGWIDVPMLIWCLCPFASSLMNDLGAYDGLSAAFAQTVTWGLPYLLGRVYFTDRVGLRELAIGLFMGGLVYVPLCLYEIKMSPQLHRMLYGFCPFDWSETRRFGGWRPTVFMEHGLMVGMWMTATSLVGLWLWATGALKRLRGVPMGFLVAALLGTTILCKSTGAMALLAVGSVVLYAGKIFGTRLALLGLVVIPLVYMSTRLTGAWSGEQLVTLSRDVAGEERSLSLKDRLNEEDILGKRAMHRPAFGWGGWGRNRPEGPGIATDGLWIIMLGKYGTAGLVALMGSLLVPIGLLLLRLPHRAFGDPALAPALATSVILGLYAVDNLMNAFVNPAFFLAAGGLSGFVGMEMWRGPASSSSRFPAGLPAGHRSIACQASSRP